jgi:hypothetical protein
LGGFQDHQVFLLSATFFKFTPHWLCLTLDWECPRDISPMVFIIWPRYPSYVRKWTHRCH